MKYIPHLKVCIPMYVYINYDKQLNRKKMYTTVGRIFVWNDIFQVDNESECFLEGNDKFSIL